MHTGLASCPICGNRDHFSRFFSGRVDLWACERCGFVSQNIGPGRWCPPADLAGDGTGRYIHSPERWRYPHRERALRDLAVRLTRVSGPGKLLDVGCGDGHFLSLCSELGWSAVGIEADANLAARAHRNTGLEIRAGQYTPESFPPESFDAISMVHCLEHFPAPQDALAAAWQQLSPGGCLCIEVPSIRSPHWLLWRMLRLRRLIDNPSGVIREHVSYFTPTSLRRLLEHERFIIRSMTTGRWAVRYTGMLRILGGMLDPLFQRVQIGGIVCLASAAKP